MPSTLKKVVCSLKECSLKFCLFQKLNSMLKNSQQSFYAKEHLNPPLLEAFSLGLSQSAQVSELLVNLCLEIPHQNSEKVSLCSVMPRWGGEGSKEIRTAMATSTISRLQHSHRHSQQLSSLAKHEVCLNAIQSATTTNIRKENTCINHTKSDLTGCINL